ncbi:MAG: hypothetical protein OEY86_14330 [Nitrospira sp.]|nr:hypothetical protein [Nitrospira sp.]
MCDSKARSESQAVARGILCVSISLLLLWRLLKAPSLPPPLRGKGGGGDSRRDGQPFLLIPFARLEEVGSDVFIQRAQSRTNQAANYGRQPATIVGNYHDN